MRLQAQDKNKAQIGHAPKYRNAAHAVYLIVKEEGPAALFKGMSLTALRQATNVSGPSIPSLSGEKRLIKGNSEFDCLHQIEAIPPSSPAGIRRPRTSRRPDSSVRSCGRCSRSHVQRSNRYSKYVPPPNILHLFQYIFWNQYTGGPTNQTVSLPITETLVQRNPTPRGHSSFSHTAVVARNLFQQEGFKALYKGITPRIMRIAPGQAITYTIYEYLKTKLSA